MPPAFIEHPSSLTPGWLGWLVFSDANKSMKTSSTKTREINLYHTQIPKSIPLGYLYQPNVKDSGSKQTGHVRFYHAPPSTRCQPAHADPPSRVLRKNHTRDPAQAWMSHGARPTHPPPTHPALIFRKTPYSGPSTYLDQPRVEIAVVMRKRLVRRALPPDP